MKSLAWLTDLHLNFLSSPDVEQFIEFVADLPADAFLLGGDIGEAPDVDYYIDALSDIVSRPVYFVLGNHDFYRGSIAGAREKVEALCINSPNLHWMPSSGVVPLTEDACLIGHDGWGDGRLGTYWRSRVELNDWRLIEEFIDLEAKARLEKLHALGDEAAAHFRAVLPEALKRFRHIVVLTHVPPFRESCWHQGRISDDEWLPHFSCKAVGDVLAEAWRVPRTGR